MDLLAQVVSKIIQEQENIIGPIALEQAQKVPGITLNWERHEVELAGDETSVVNNLVEQYRHLFGQASVEVCKEAASSLLKGIPKSQVPATLA